MARIPEVEIERLKSDVSVWLAEARGIRLERHGADLIGLCPFHEDRNASLGIDVEKLRIQGYDEKNAGRNGGCAGSKRGQNGGMAGGSRGGPGAVKTGLRGRFGRFGGKHTDTGPGDQEPVIAAGGR